MGGTGRLTCPQHHSRGPNSAGQGSTPLAQSQSCTSPFTQCASTQHAPQDLASSVLAARDTAQLIAVTHPGAARQMQRMAAQMIAALQLLARDGEPNPWCPV